MQYRLLYVCFVAIDINNLLRVVKHHLWYLSIKRYLRTRELGLIIIITNLHRQSSSSPPGTVYGRWRLLANEAENKQIFNPSCKREIDGKKITNHMSWVSPVIEDMQSWQVILH